MPEREQRGANGRALGACDHCARYPGEQHADWCEYRSEVFVAAASPSKEEAPR